MIEYRPIEASDIPLVTALFEQHLNSGQPIKDTIRRLWEAGVYWGYAAYENGEVLGFMTICPGIAFTYPHPELEAELAAAVGTSAVAYCDAILVLPGHRGRGVAKALAGRIGKLLREKRFDCLLAEIWIYPDGSAPAKVVFETVGEVVWRRRIDGFYRDLERYGMSCPVCGRKCVCGAWVELIRLGQKQSG